MKNLIKKILKEEFINSEVMSSKKNICDVMSLNNWSEVEELLDVMSFDEKYQKEIDGIKREWKKEVDSQSHDGDSTNFYLRKVQNLVCR